VRSGHVAMPTPPVLLIEGLLDDLAPRDAIAVADGIRDLGRDTAIIATGSSAGSLALACDEILTLSDGIRISG
jgi:hypothetical protein